MIHSQFIMGQIEKVGDTVSIGGSNSEKMDTFKSGTLEMIGSDVQLSRTNTPFGVFTDQNMGAVEMVGDDCGKLKRTPHRGYESGTPINAQEELPDTKETY